MKPMTDQELAPYEKGAPLMVERYKELRQAADQLAAAGIAAQRSLKLAREGIEKFQREAKDLELQRDELRAMHAQMCELAKQRAERIEELESDRHSRLPAPTELDDPPSD